MNPMLQSADSIIISSSVPSNDGNKLLLQTAEGLLITSCNDILRCEAEGHQCTFHMVDGSKIRVRKNLKFFESKLEAWRFFRVHKSNMVNLRHVRRYVRGESSYVELTDKTQVKVAVRQRPKFQQSLALI